MDKNQVKILSEAGIAFKGFYRYKNIVESKAGTTFGISVNSHLSISHRLFLLNLGTVLMKYFIFSLTSAINKNYENRYSTRNTGECNY